MIREALERLRPVFLALDPIVSFLSASVQLCNDAADPEVVVIACGGHQVTRTLQDLRQLEAFTGWHQLRAKAMWG